MKNAPSTSNSPNPYAPLARISSAIAQTTPKTSVSFSELVRGGFKIVSTVLAPAGSTTDNHAAVVVTLTRETSVAICTVNVSNYENFGTVKWPDEAERCDVRKF